MSFTLRWKDFSRDMFWLGIFGGSLALLHILILLLLKWRMRTKLRGAVLLPRFELFLLILALPCICQASACLIRGGSIAGIIVGVLLLSVPAAFLLSVFLFISIAIFMGAFLQYKEVIPDKQVSWGKGVLSLLVGTEINGEWLVLAKINKRFLSQFGLLFEDFRGPPYLIVIEGKQRNDRGSVDATKSVRTHSDDDSEITSVREFQKIMGSFRSAYIIVDLARRVMIGVVLGVYPSSDSSWSQLAIVFSFTVFQLLYLVVFKPYIRRGLQTVESVSLFCEAGVSAACLYLISRDRATHDHRGLGFFMISLMVISFVAQLVNEWYALMKQLTSLSPSGNSFAMGTKMMVFGLLILLFPERTWSMLLPEISPTHAQVALPASGSLKGRRKTGTRAHKSEHVGVGVQDASALRPRGNDRAQSGEIRVESEPSQPWLQHSISKVLEGKRQRNPRADATTSELRMLREIAKASFQSCGRNGEDLTGVEASTEMSFEK
eukprot:c22723_g1_i1 orf=973-2448(+)